MRASAVDVAIVDDDDSVRRSLTQLLRAAGFNPVSYASAEEYLANSTGARAHCLVLDIQLGGMSGFDLRERLVAAGVAPPTIFITAHERLAPARTARAAGCVACLTKPILGSSLIEAVREAVGSGNGHA